MDSDKRVVVIGSGPTGATAALVLAGHGIPVTVLESGGQMPEGRLIRLMGKNVYRRRSEIPNANHVASDDPNTAWFHAFVPGGLSNYWTGLVPRFAPEDFTEGERLHERYRWPVSYEDLAPYYDYVERLMGVVGDSRDVPQLPASVVRTRHSLPKSWRTVAKHAEAMGHGLTTAPRADVRSWMVTRSGAAFNSYTRLIPSLRRFPRFDLRLGAHALYLEWDGAEQRVSGVIYRDRATGREERLGAAAVVLAAGPLSSTKLLLDSACSDFPEGLGDTYGLLGYYLHDHPKDWCVFEIDRPLPRLEHNAYLTRARYDESRPLLAASWTIGNTSTRDKLLSIAGVPTTVFGTQIFGTLVPTERNFVRLHPEQKDEFGLPKLDVHIHFGAEELENMAASRERLLAVLESAGYHGRFEWHMPRLTPGESVHYGGTIRMHASPRYGMLNGWGRLHAIDNVAVADASAFTTGPEKNPTPTAMALAARAADRLGADLKTSSGAVGRSKSYAAQAVR